MSNLKIMLDRLEKVGVKLELAGNFPWVYISKINGVPVKEKLNSDWGFVICYSPKETGGDYRFNDIKETFNLIRKYTKERENKLKRILKK